MSLVAPAIEIRELQLSFDGRDVLRGFTMSAAIGERILLTGPSGSGKSCILRCLMGLCVPSAGSVSIMGTEVTGDSVWALRRQASLLAQEPDLGGGVVKDVLLRPFSYKANAALTHTDRDVLELFELFGLPPHTLEKDMTDLSGGEKQRVGLVLTALLRRPLVLLDEPASALDRECARAVRNYFRDTYDGTVIVAAHHADGFELGGRVVEIGGEGLA